MTKWSRGSERTRLDVLIVEAIHGVSSSLSDLHPPRCSPVFSSVPAAGMLLGMTERAGGGWGVRDTLTGRQTQR